MQELDKILEISCIQQEAGENDYLQQLRTGGSFYISRKDTVYLKEMDFTTPVKLQSRLHEMWGNEPQLLELEKVIAVAAFKLRDSDAVYAETIKEKVYNF